VRDGSRHAGDRRPAESLGDGSVDWLDGEWQQPVGGRSGGRLRLLEEEEPCASERITLIEFQWEGQAGAQQVIFVSREWLQ
jgi:hypothetical protein